MRHEAEWELYLLRGNDVRRELRSDPLISAAGDVSR